LQALWQVALAPLQPKLAKELPSPAQLTAFKGGLRICPRTKTKLGPLRHRVERYGIRNANFHPVDMKHQHTTRGVANVG